MDQPEAKLEHSRVLFSMIPFLFYSLAALLFGASALVMRNTTALARVGGREYEKRRTRKVIGPIFIIAGLIATMLGVLNQEYSTTVPDETILANNPTAPSQAAHATPAEQLSKSLSTPTSTTSNSAPNLDNLESQLAMSPSTQAITGNTAPKLDNLAPQPSMLTSIPAPPSDSGPNSDSVAPQSGRTSDFLLQEARQFYEQDKADSALAKASDAITADHNNSAAYTLRGTIYAQQRRWDPAEEDFLTVLKLDGETAQVRFNVAEIEFTKKEYESARRSFVLMQNNSSMSDLAAYKIFLCDLLGGNQAAATPELAVFNRAGANASYYFANAASCLYNHKPDDARGWLQKAGYIYPPAKYKLYADSLKVFGNLASSELDPPSPVSLP